MKSLEARQADRAKRRAEEDEVRKASGFVKPGDKGDGDEDGDEADTGKTKKSKAKGPTTLADAGVAGGVDAQAGNGGGANPFGGTAQ